jgi:hypothetical protein
LSPACAFQCGKLVNNAVHRLDDFELHDRQVLDLIHHHHPEMSLVEASHVRNGQQPGRMAQQVVVVET